MNIAHRASSQNIDMLQIINIARGRLTGKNEQFIKVCVRHGSVRIYFAKQAF